MRRLDTTLMTLAALAGLLAAFASPALAWKPKTHIYLAEQALKDAIDDGKVTIYLTDYKSGKILGKLGDFPVDPAILEAIKAYPKQYRAGVLGPDAYPDIVTGQTLIHPHVAKPLDGQIAGGTNSWLQHLYDLSYGPQSTWRTGPVRAFVVGYITHAAGDMFAHTFMNNYSGGEFMLTPDPRNALKHLVLEAYIGKRTPLPFDAFGPGEAVGAVTGSSYSRVAMERLKQAGVSPVSAAGIGVLRKLEEQVVTENDVSIEGVNDFIYSEMVYAKRGTVLMQKLYQVDGRNKSVPYLFSELRNSLRAEVDAYNAKSTAGRAAYNVTHPGRIQFIDHWIKDIDRGLQRWPLFSDELAKALVYDETAGGADLPKAKKIVNDYVKDYLVYMGPVPDVAVDVLKFMGEIMDALVPDFIKEAIDELVKDAANTIAEAATGRTIDEWVEYVSNPEQHFDPIMNADGGARPGRTANHVTLAEMNQILKIGDTGFQDGGASTFKIEDFPPAFNTLQMCMLLMLRKDGVGQLLKALEDKGCPPNRFPPQFENVMLGFQQSLDNDNQWHGAADRDSNPQAMVIFAQNGGAPYQRLFLKQIGEQDWVSDAPQNTPGSSTPSTPRPPRPGTGTGPSAPPAPEDTGKALSGLVGKWKTTLGTTLSIDEAIRTTPPPMLHGHAVRGPASATVPLQAEDFYLSVEDGMITGLWKSNPTDSPSNPGANGRVRVSLNPDGDSFAGAVTLADGKQVTYNGTRIRDTDPGQSTGTPSTGDQSSPPSSSGNDGSAGSDGGTGSSGSTGSTGTTPKPPTTPGGATGSPGDGRFRPLDTFDFRLDEVKAGRGRTIEMIVTYKNAKNGRAGVVSSTANLTVTDSDGMTFRDMGNLYRVNGDPPVKVSGTLWLEPGETVRVRYIFNVPDGVTALRKLSVGEHGTKAQLYDLSTVEVPQ